MNVHEIRCRNILRTLGEHLMHNTELGAECDVRLLARACKAQGELAEIELDAALAKAVEYATPRHA